MLSCMCEFTRVAISRRNGFGDSLPFLRDYRLRHLCESIMGKAINLYFTSFTAIDSLLQVIYKLHFESRILLKNSNLTRPRLNWVILFTNQLFSSILQIIRWFFRICLHACVGGWILFRQRIALTSWIAVG